MQYGSAIMPQKTSALKSFQVETDREDKKRKGRRPLLPLDWCTSGNRVFRNRDSTYTHTHTYAKIDTQRESETRRRKKERRTRTRARDNQIDGQGALQTETVRHSQRPRDTYKERKEDMKRTRYASINTERKRKASESEQGRRSKYRKREKEQEKETVLASCSRRTSMRFKATACSRMWRCTRSSGVSSLSTLGIRYTPVRSQCKGRPSRSWPLLQNGVSAR